MSTRPGPHAGWWRPTTSGPEPEGRPPFADAATAATAATAASSPASFSAELGRLLASLEAREAGRAPGRLAALARSARELGVSYRSDGVARVTDRTTAVSYALTRLKATASAMRAALGEAAASLPSFAPESHLDLGTGCGAGLLAAASAFGLLGRQVGLDRSAAMLELAGELRDGVASAPPPSRLELVEARLEHALGQVGRFDLVTAGYCLGEVDDHAGDAVLEAAFAATTGLLVVVEPGTPEGFGAIRRWRRRLLELGGSAVAPCPHDDSCPCEPGNWCHFSARVEHSAFVRRVKAASRAYDDEKFSYLALSPAGSTASPASEACRPEGRVLRHPWHAKSRVGLVICAAGGTIEHLSVTRREPAYRAASRVRWGDRYPR